MPEKDFTKKVHKLASDLDALVQQVQKGVTRVVADATDVKDSLDEVRERFRRPEDEDE